MEYGKIKVIISGGGTGGHIFPAISIADKLKEVNPDTEILFVGAEGKMEMEKVPAAGYEIVALPIIGLQRKFNFHNLLSNLKVPFKVLSSLAKARKIIKKFKPDVVIGVGGFASAPLLWKATSMRVPSLIQEQNGFAGLTNRILGKRVGAVCVAYENMERFFPAEKIVITGNPIRKGIHSYGAAEREEGLKLYGFSPEKKHILILGGSLGAGTVNNAVKKWIGEGCPGNQNVEVLWQCGGYYKNSIDEFMKGKCVRGINYVDFITRMDLAYALADVVISRSGASSVSEICAAEKAAVFVPSPNVAEDHQTHNAMALVNKGAAKIVKDSEAAGKLMDTALALAFNPAETSRMAKEAYSLSKPDAALTIIDEVYKLI